MSSYVNSLVDLINVNDEFELKIKLSEEKMDKLFKENAELSEIKIAYDDLKNLYDEKEKIWSNSSFDLDQQNYDKEILTQISKNVDLNNAQFSIRGSHIVVRGKDGARIVIPNRFLPEIRKLRNK